MSKPKQKPDVTPALFSERDAAAYMSLSANVLRSLAARGEIPTVRVPGFRRVAYATDDLRAVIERWKGSPSNDAGTFLEKRDAK